MEKSPKAAQAIAGMIKTVILALACLAPAAGCPEKSTEDKAPPASADQKTTETPPAAAALRPAPPPAASVQPAKRPVTVESLKAMREKLRPLHKKLGPPGPHDWLASNPEQGQTFEEYLESNPPSARGGQRTIYIQILGKFGPGQRKVVGLAAEFIGLYYNCPVKMGDPLPLSLVPPAARRTPGVATFGEQVHAGFVMEMILLPRLPKDAAAYIAFTSADLWPGDGPDGKKWNFVFGQASLSERVGVWSIVRFGDPEKEFGLCLLRTMKLGTHETGHMFGIAHCTAWECNLCGSNGLFESDRMPLALCPECVAKACWAADADPVERYRKLAAFCRKHELKEQAEFYEKSIEALKE
jgi:archaemetzincin